MAKCPRKAKPCTPDYFVGYMAEREKEVFEQRVVCRMPRVGDDRTVWAEDHDPGDEGHRGAWGDCLDPNAAIRLARVLAVRCGLWDGKVEANWLKFACELLGPLDDDWTMTIAEVARVWREVHPSPVAPDPNRGECECPNVTSGSRETLP